jgi:hypothetical protein
MNARFDAETTRRWLGIAGAVAVIAIPIALIGATWEPLEPLPRTGRPALVDDAATPERSRGERSSRRDRDRGQDAAPGIATPYP